jgi:hypothetical protein
MKKNYVILCWLILFIICGCVYVSNEKVEVLRKQNLPIAIPNLWVHSPNSAGGVSVSLEFKNISDKTIKYITFNFQAFNRVNDPVNCTIRNSSNRLAEVTGPILPMKGQHVAWSNLWYNSTIDNAKIKSVQIEYMDGSEKFYNESDVNKMICF